MKREQVREVGRVHCPFCRNADSRVLDSRASDDGTSIRRRRQCPACERRFTTVEQMQLVVVKKSGVVEPFSRDKVVQGVRKACKGRPVSDADLAKLGQRVEEALRASGMAEVPTEEVGVAILGPLSELDPVAYLRFASVYKHYESVDDFAAEIAAMREGAQLDPDVEAVAQPDRVRKHRASSPASAQPTLESIG
ncbi:Transcriptional repressor NrdR [Aestuariimicrobium sp. T2.26MG-19.2B]|nr:Transcriptional repressor NrdR [Aestuariimicrobium sp. T2.26MG-19.2B]